jgi:hypothetical protein
MPCLISRPSACTLILGETDTRIDDWMTSAASVRLDPPNHIPAVHNNTNAVRHGTRRKQMEGAGEPVILRQAVVS